MDHLATTAGAAPTRDAPAPEPLLELKRLPLSYSPGRDAVTYGVVVRNNGPDLPLWVRLEHELPAGAVHHFAEPPGQLDGRTLSWDLGKIEPHGERPVALIVHRDDPRGDFDLAAIRFRAGFQKPAPASLAVALAPPAAAAPGDRAELVVEVINTGGLAANQVLVATTLPRGLHRAAGQDVALTIPVVRPHSKLRLTLHAVAAEVGDHAVSLTASTADGLRSQAHATVSVRAPRLAVRLTGPARGELGRHAEYRVEVVNEGPGLAANVRAACAWPDELAFVAASAEVSHSGQELAWPVGDLPPGQPRALSLTLAPRLPGDVVCRASAAADNGHGGAAELATAIGFSSDAAELAPGRALDDLLRTLDQAATRGNAGAEVNAGRAARGRGEGTEHVVFSLAGTDYAIPITSVQEIGRPLATTPVPNVPDWLLGLANVRGDIVSLIDLRQFLGLGRAEPGPLARLLVARAQAEDVTVGLIVDQVRGIRALTDGEVEAAAVEDRVSPYLRGVAARDGGVLVVFDTDRLLLSAEMKCFDAN